MRPGRERSSTVLIVSRRVHRVARDDVRPARAVLVQQPAAVRVAALELRGVLRMVRHDGLAALLLPPAEGRHVVVVAVQEAGLAGARLGGPVGLPAQEPVAAVVRPARQVGRVAVADGAPEHVVREPVDLEEVDAGDLARSQPSAARLATDGVAVPEVLVVDREEGGEDRVHRCQADRDDHPVQDTVDRDAGVQRRRRRDHESVQEQRAEAQREHRERQRDPDDQRPDERVREPDERGRRERRRPVCYVEAGHDRAEQQQGAGREEPDQRRSA